jgi:hypothetical protein
VEMEMERTSIVAVEWNGKVTRHEVKLSVLGCFSYTYLSILKLSFVVPTHTPRHRR